MGPKILRNQRGLATVEAVPLLVVFVMLTGFSLGLWGSVHTAILHSIAARTYAFETFANRVDLTSHRLDCVNGANCLSMRQQGVRFHSIVSERVAPEAMQWPVTTRPLSVGYRGPAFKTKQATHLDEIFSLKPRNQSIEVGPIWIMVGYGMCLDATCGGN